MTPDLGDTVLDFDFHPDVRVFTIPRSGVLLAGPGVPVYEVRYGQVVMRHYAFADQWFKLNVTTDVLVRQDARTYQVCDQDEFDQAQRDGLISPAETAGAQAGLAALVRLIEAGRLPSFLSDIVVFGPSTAPAALPESVVALADVERLKVRPGGHRLPP